MPVETQLDDLGLHQPDAKRLVSFLQAMEFTTITRRVAELYGVDAHEIEPDPDFVGPAGWRARNGEVDRRRARPGARKRRRPPSRRQAPTASRPRRSPPRARRRRWPTKIDRSTYETVMSVERLDQWIADAFAAGVVALDTETTSLDPMSCELVGVSLRSGAGPRLLHSGAASRGRQWRSLRRRRSRRGADSAGKRVIEKLKPLFEDDAVLKIAHNMKYDLLVLSRYGIDVAPIEDTMLISYALDTGRNNHGLDELAQKHLGHREHHLRRRSRDRAAISSASRASPLDKATEYAAEDADVSLRLWRALQAAPRRRAERRPSTRRWSGRWSRRSRAWSGAAITIDRHMLSRLSGEFAQDMARLEADIFELAGESFNLGSPKQLGDILFGKMGLPGAKKTATGAWSTSASVLEDLAAEGNDFAAPHSRLAPAFQAQEHLCRRAAGLREQGNRARAHLLLAGRDDDGAALVVGAQSAEHSRAQRSGPQDPQGLRRRAGQCADHAPIIRRSNCGCSRISPIFRSSKRLSPRISTFTP